MVHFSKSVWLLRSMNISRSYKYTAWHIRVMCSLRFHYGTSSASIPEKFVRLVSPTSSLSRPWLAEMEACATKAQAGGYLVVWGPEYMFRNVYFRKQKAGHNNGCPARASNLSIYLSTYLPIYLSTYLSIYLSTYLPIYLSTYLSIYLSNLSNLSIRPSVSPSIHPSILVCANCACLCV